MFKDLRNHYLSKHINEDNTILGNLLTTGNQVKLNDIFH